MTYYYGCRLNYVHIHKGKTCSDDAFLADQTAALEQTFTP